MKALAVYSLMFLGLSGQALGAGDAAAGKVLAGKVCAACHQLDGISKSDVYPNLAGQRAAYIQKQILAFQAGTRTDSLMSVIAKTLTASDIENAAAYFSSIGAAK